MKNITSLKVVIIRPANYDDDGYVIRYMKGVLPSNTLACMRNLTLDFADRWEKERGIKISVEIYDEIVHTIPFKKLARQNRGTKKVVAAIAGVQTNQFSRASDLAKRFTSMGIKTLIGGFHVSGVLAMFNDPTPEIQELIDRGVTIVHGEAEHIWESILYDVVTGREKLLYRMTEFPDIAECPVPQPNTNYLKKFALPGMGTIDCSRGCPFNCSFCTIINVQGHKMRYRSAQSILKTIRNNYNRGIKQYFFTDDNFSRNPEWEPILDGMIHMREKEKMEITYMMQVDMTCNLIKNFVSKSSRAGCTQVFIGMESINQKNLDAAGKKQNKVENYPSFIDSWHNVGVATHAGYIIGFPFDTPESVSRDIQKLKNVIKIDQASFFMLTPLPGSMDHYNLVQSGAYMDTDLNKYDSFHTVTHHPLMSSNEWIKAYQDAWVSFYEFDNLKKILMRAGQKEYWSIFKNLMWYKNSLLEPRHPMVAGFIRRKNRRDVRPGTRVMGIPQFYVMRTREMLVGLKKRIHLFFELQELWWLTRKTDDPTFKLVADFTSVLYDAKNRFSSIEFNTSYSKWCEEMNIVLSSLTKKISSYYNTNCLSGKAKRKFNRLIEETNAYLAKINVSDYYNRGITFFTHYLTNTIQLVENASIKNVARRRNFNHFWKLTWIRVKHGNIFSFSLSIPIIIISAVRDFRMSIIFAYNLLKQIRS